jgi:hypothetical protein
MHFSMQQSDDRSNGRGPYQLAAFPVANAKQAGMSQNIYDLFTVDSAIKAYNVKMSL